MPPPRLWPRNKKIQTAAPIGAAVFYGGSPQGAAAPRRLCAVRAFCRRQNLAAGRIYSARGYQKTGSPPAFTLVGRDCPPWLRRRQSPPPRRWPRKADSKRKPAAPNGAAGFMGAVLRARERPGAFAPLEHFAEGKISPLFRRLPEPAGAFRRAAARLEWNQIPRKPCCARIPASEARTFAPRSGAKVTAFLQAVRKVLGLF